MTFLIIKQSTGYGYICNIVWIVHKILGRPTILIINVNVTNYCIILKK